MFGYFGVQVKDNSKELIDDIKKGVDESIEMSSQLHNTDMIVNYDKYYEEVNKDNDQ